LGAVVADHRFRINLIGELGMSLDGLLHIVPALGLKFLDAGLLQSRTDAFAVEVVVVLGPLDQAGLGALDLRLRLGRPG
jgi:hypothetical protein